ncbi:regulatory protein YycI of two-component signal transduction system YycFG [Bacillus niacini]|uniref:Regulatory protein YycI of two-component signal transduction system YycFG n=1 Tax=Neobacillus niacini TaxID=86668 RepID=A0A852TEI0_9BACI|nr:two-component system regulatory protein YycI [Neobacillus niacini]NYE06176.1 regulatory protein YycI of two-component signal transduction system YycFG [Neobacillus niacini]
MDWSKIKTIFIITFLILDVYLLFQFMKIRDANKYEYITPTSIEETLKLDEISYKELPKGPFKDQYLSAKPKLFTRDDILKLKGQTTALKEPSTSLQMKLDKPIPLNEKFEAADITAFIKDNVLYGDQYQFWKKDDKKNTITYFQHYGNMTLYENLSGMLTFHIDEKNQIDSYEQTYLEDIEKMTEKEEILPPLKALETLYQKGMLKPKSKITKVELGYSSLIQLSASQALAPTWRFVVDDNQSLFVNALEGQIIEFNSDGN